MLSTNQSAIKKNALVYTGLLLFLVLLSRGFVQEPAPNLTPRQLQDNLTTGKFTGRRIDLVFSRAGLQEVIAELERVGGILLKLDPSINDPVTYRLQNVSWDEALAAVLSDNGLHIDMNLDEAGFKIGRGKMVVLAFPERSRAKVVLFLYDNLIPLAAGIVIVAAGAIGFWLWRRRRARLRKANKKPLLPSEDVEEVKARLTLGMKNDRLYRDEELTLQSLAETLGVTPHQLSWIINDEMGLSFSSLINGHRIDEVKSRLADASFNGASILQAAMEAGFNSKASFNRAFKIHTGMTPSEYKKNLL